MEWLMDAQTWAALLTLTALEIVLGVDNVVFISILAGKLPHAEQPHSNGLHLLRNGIFSPRRDAQSEASSATDRTCQGLREERAS